MLLRTRVSLFVIVIFVIVWSILTVIALKREALVRAQYSAEIISDQTTLWDKINEGIVQHMEDKAWIVAENPTFIDVLAEKDNEGIQRVGAEIAKDLIDGGIADRFDAVYADGSLAYSSRSAVFPSATIVSAAAREAVAGGKRVRGTGNDKQRNISVVLGIPLRVAAGEVVGLGIYATDIKKAVTEMERVTNSSVQIVNRRGRLLVGTENSLWASLEGQFVLDQVETLQTVEANGRVYSGVVLTQSVALGGLVGRLVSLRDVTEHALAQKRVSQITIGALIAFLLLMLFALNYYTRRIFAPLTEGVGVLNALSRGDLDAHVESPGGRDEVGRIVSAVGVFRTNLIAVDRIRRSRKRQHNRQERFIRRKLTGLAETLDEDEREAVLKELAQLEHQVDEALNHGEALMKNHSPVAEVGQTPDMSRESDSLALVASAFQKMSERVQDQNQRLREALASKNAFIALQKELDIAGRVQLSFLPEPMEPTATFELTGLMKAAKEIGGDFYDFFRLDEHRLGVVIADVSGKGVPAALFMAMARTVMRATAPHVREPGRVLAMVNELLTENNGEQLFVTVFYGILDERTGRFTYANGGHNPPVLLDSQGARPLPLTDGALLAMFGGLKYPESSVVMEAGARLVLLTDGVTEAINKDLEEFGDARLEDLVRALPEQSTQQDIDTIINAVEAFAGEENQFDDITCVVLRYKGGADDSDAPSSTADLVLTLTLPNDVAEIVHIAGKLEAHGASRGWPAEPISKLNLVLDELITNVISYGYRDDERHEIRITVNERDGLVTTTIEDDGMPFDPFKEAPAPDLDAKLEERRIGGLGVHIAKSFTDEVAYERRGKYNRTILKLRLRQ